MTSIGTLFNNIEVFIVICDDYRTMKSIQLKDRMVMLYMLFKKFPSGLHPRRYGSVDFDLFSYSNMKLFVPMAALENVPADNSCTYYEVNSCSDPQMFQDSLTVENPSGFSEACGVFKNSSFENIAACFCSDDDCNGEQTKTFIDNSIRLPTPLPDTTSWSFVPISNKTKEVLQCFRKNMYPPGASPVKESKADESSNLMEWIAICVAVVMVICCIAPVAYYYVAETRRVSYYSEEKTFSATPYTKPTRAPPISQTKLNARGLKDLDDHDIDGLLSNLSIEELEDLNDDFDPDIDVLVGETLGGGKMRQLAGAKLVAFDTFIGGMPEELPNVQGRGDIKYRC
ncbi:unnamed protein product [Haemonchus placei]|uniref:Activin_recp domain-containing protein n=1 Tax=Haemonchus placei TaxID=6290 RepID=A0A0N4W942_HAEPC|nr:unnamed protein product [Haemonchus placei]